MGQCLACSCRDRQSNRKIHTESTVGEAEPPVPVENQFKLKQQSQNNRELTRFFSFDVDERGNIKVENKGLTLPENEQLVSSKEDPLRCTRTGEFYGPRDRIPSLVDIGNFDAEYWWSSANLGRPSITHDMGLSPTVLSRPIKVSVIPSSFFASHRDLDVFPEYKAVCGGFSVTSYDTSTEASPVTTAASSVCVPARGPIRLIIFKLKMNDKVMVSLNEVIDHRAFDQIFNKANRDELLKKKLKLILSPINSPLPIPAKKPNDAETIGSYFGMENVDFQLDETLGSVKVVSILVNIYAKWIIRKFMPLVTGSPGRMCDFILLSSDDKVVYANFRLLATQVSQALISNTS